MSDDQQSSDGRADDNATSHDLAAVERNVLRLTFWQTVLSLVGVFIGAVALYAALTESQAVRKQTSASVWPYVQLMIRDTDDGEDAWFEIALENKGVGPAKMRSVQFLLDDQALLNWSQVTETLFDQPVQVGVDYGRSSLAGRVIAPGESLIAFRTGNRDLVLKLQSEVYSGRTALNYCYCSIFDDCWLVKKWSDTPDTAPRSVEACPDWGETAFQD